MAYEETNWVNGKTAINSDNLNKIENELETLDQEGIIVSPTEPTTDRRKVWMQMGKNLFNANNVLGNFIVNGAGDLSANSVWTASNKIYKINSSKPYTISWKNISSTEEPQVEIAEYKKNGVFNRNNFNTLPIGTTSFSKVLDSDTAYLIIAYRNDRMKDIQLEQGEKQTEFESYVEPNIYVKNDNDVYEGFEKDYPIEIKNDKETALKFKDGTLICYARKAFDVNFKTANSRYNIDNPFIFPIEFIENPTINVTTANDADYKFCTIIGVIRDHTSISKVCLFCDALGSGTVVLHYIAIGRWK